MLDLEPIFLAVRQAAALCKQVQLARIVHSVSPQSTASSDDSVPLHTAAVPKDGVASKSGAEPVTLADYGSQAILCRAISRAFPDDAIIAEEGAAVFKELINEADQQAVAEWVGGVLETPVTVDDIVKWLDHGQGREAARTWVIDPIDGTKGFIAMRHYVIALGILEGGQVTGGVIGAPTYPTQEGGLIFHAQNGSGYAQPMAGGAARRLRVSARKTEAELLVVESVEKSHASREIMARVRERAGIGAARVQHLDSQEKYSMIAAGDADLYLRLPRMNSTRPHMIWDHAPGAALVFAAGGKVTDVDGTPLDFSLGKTLANNKGMIVSNGLIHDQVVKAAQEVLKEL